MSKARSDYPDNYFHDSRMSFGDHIEELRTHLLLAVYGFVICLAIGFVLDFIGTSTGLPIGLGKPVLKIIEAPAKQEMQAFYARRLVKMEERSATAAKEDPASLIRTPYTLTAKLQTKSLTSFVELKQDSPEAIEITLEVAGADIYALARKGEMNSGELRTLTTLSAQEAFMVYFKVSLLCGVVLSSPWIFYQVWAFISAGLYPHEKRHIHLYLPFSLGLFLTGVFMCQFLVLPKAVGALLSFNEWLGLDPDLRLSEWLGFAVILPLVFGISFQTPLVMVFLTKAGIFTAEAFAKKWRVAVMVLAVFAAVITPTPDAISWTFLFVPMFGLYLLGIWLCSFVKKDEWEDGEEDEEFGV